MKVCEHIVVNNLRLSKFQVRNTTVDHESSMMTTATQTSTIHKQSLVWKYFQRIKTGETLQAKCLIKNWHKVLSTPLYSTTTLIRHLRDVHKVKEFQDKEKLVNRSNKKKISSHLKKKIDQAALVAIIQDGRTFDDFSKPGFRKFLQLIVPSKKTLLLIYLLYSATSDLDYRPPHRNYINKHLKRLHTKHAGSMINLLSKVPFIAITTDFWSDKGSSYLVLTGHYINHEFNLHSTVLRFSTFQKRHFSELIGAEIQKQLVELNIFEKVTSITCDSAPNMIKMFNYLTRLDIIRIRCQAHLLHLIVCNGLGLWLGKKKKKANTTDKTNLIDPEERLSQSLQTINIIDKEESTDEEYSGENSIDAIEDEGENEDLNGEKDEIIDLDDNQENHSDDYDTDSFCSDDENDNTFDDIEDNFEVGVITDANEYSNLSSTQLDERITLVVEKSRDLIGMIKDNSILYSFVQQKKEEHNLHNDDKIKRSLHLDVRTRWNSTFKMLTTLKLYRYIITDLFQNMANLGITKEQYQRLAAMEFSSNCWYTVELLVKVLKPFYGVTKTIGGSEYPTIGLAFLMFRRLDKDFLSVVKPTDAPLFNHMKDCLLKKLIYYTVEQDPSQTETILFHAYFDPFAVSAMTSSEINTIENEIKYLIRQSTSNSQTQTSTASSSFTNTSNINKFSSSSKQNGKKKSFMDYFFDTLVEDDNNDTKQTQKTSLTSTKIINNEIKLYKTLASQFVAKSVDSYEPMTFWKENKLLLPNLVILAQKYLATPSTSIKSESAFSIAAYYGRKQRARLSSTNLGFSVFLKDKLSSETN
ncbi:unnamed protein product [Rotaria sp. Silwood2]|nr:unnamed protein product [Rotaria sp. Silwood2]CAF4507957.1 unnamed protein product [Rotaria sp. Silwood2]